MTPNAFRRRPRFERFRALHGDTRGTVTIEYAVLIGTMAIAGAVGLVVVGLAIVESFVFVRALLLSGVP